MTSNAVIVEFRSSLLFIPVDRLMSSIEAGYIASSAAYALIFIEVRQKFKVSVEFFCRYDVRKSNAYEIFKTVVSSFIHEVHET